MHGPPAHAEGSETALWRKGHPRWPAKKAAVGFQAHTGPEKAEPVAGAAGSRTGPSGWLGEKGMGRLSYPDAALRPRGATGETRGRAGPRCGFRADSQAGEREPAGPADGRRRRKRGPGRCARPGLTLQPRQTRPGRIPRPPHRPHLGAAEPSGQGGGGGQSGGPRAAPGPSAAARLRTSLAMTATHTAILEARRPRHVTPPRVTRPPRPRPAAPAPPPGAPPRARRFLPPRGLRGSRSRCYGAGRRGGGMAAAAGAGRRRARGRGRAQAPQHRAPAHGRRECGRRSGSGDGPGRRGAAGGGAGPGRGGLAAGTVRGRAVRRWGWGAPSGQGSGGGPWGGRAGGRVRAAPTGLLDPGPAVGGLAPAAPD